MPSFKKALLALCAVTAIAGAQAFDTTIPGTFVDISAGLGTAILAAGDDTGHTIVTTIGNAMFPAGNVRVGSNGAVMGGLTTGAPAFTNTTIGTTGVPGGLTAGGTAYLCPHWDDLFASTNPNTTIYWYEDLVNSILYIQWNNIEHFSGGVGEVVTFQVQVFGLASGLCQTYIQYLYSDTVFGGTAAAADNGASATIGYVKGSVVGFTNALYSFNVANNITSGSVVSIVNKPAFTLVATSPGGAGDLQLDIAGGSCAGATYFLAVTLAQGTYPAGWFYGLDLPVTDLINLYNTGFPFVGPLPAGGGTFTIGPIGAGALPSGFQFWAVATRLAPNGAINGNTPAITYIIP